MNKWYAHIGGRQYGPASLEQLRQWVREGRLSGRDMVWCEGMADWVAAQTVPELFRDRSAPPLPGSLVPVRARSGTGGQTLNRRLRSQAWKNLRGRWGLAIGFCLLLGAITGTASATLDISWKSVTRAGCAADDSNFSRKTEDILYDMRGSLFSPGKIVSLIISGPFAVGSCIFFLTFTRSRRGLAKIGMMFKGFKIFGNALLAHFLVGLFTLLWMLLLIVPGIIAGLSYSQTFSILAEHSTLGGLEAIRRSKQLMHGHKWRLFCMQMHFALLAVLCVLTCGIGFIWLMPYIDSTCARFYDDLQPAPVIAA